MDLVKIIAIGVIAAAIVVGLGSVNFVAGFLAMFPVYKAADWLMHRVSTPAVRERPLPRP